MWDVTTKFLCRLFFISRLIKNAEVTEARIDDWLKGHRENPQDLLRACLLELFASGNVLQTL